MKVYLYILSSDESNSRTQALASDEDRARVLTKAVRRVADYLSLTHRDLAQVLGHSEATVSRFAQGRVIPYPSKEGELAALLVRLYRSWTPSSVANLTKHSAGFAPRTHT